MRKGIAFWCFALALGCGGAAATDVTFSGTLTGICTLAVPTPGTLGLAADGSLGSSAGVPATLTILSVGSNTVTVAAPSWVSTPGGYSATGESLSVAYLGVGGLSVVNQAYTTSSTNFAVSTLPLTALTINAKATNTSGFVAGTHQMKVVVTCS
jgi:hypothetical protein